MASRFKCRVVPEGLVDSIVADLNDRHGIDAFVIDEDWGTFSIPKEDAERARKVLTVWAEQSDFRFSIKESAKNLDWRERLYEETSDAPLGVPDHPSSSVYWMVDYDNGGKQVRLKAMSVFAAYNWYLRNGSLEGCNYLPADQLAALDRLFDAEDEQKMEAFMYHTGWTTQGRQLMPPTSVTGGGVDLSGFELQRESTSHERYKRRFKQDELEHELRHEEPGYRSRPARPAPRRAAPAPTGNFTPLRVPFARKDEFKQIAGRAGRWNNEQRTWEVDKQALSAQQIEQLKAVGIAV